MEKINIAQKLSLIDDHWHPHVLYIYIVPVFAVILSLAILRERFLWMFWLGTALVLGGIITANVFASREKGQANK